MDFATVHNILPARMPTSYSSSDKEHGNTVASKSTTSPPRHGCPQQYHRSLQRTLSEKMPYQPEFPPTKTLIEQICDRRWNEARVRILTYPWDAHYKSPKPGIATSGGTRTNHGEKSSTPLHLVCLYRAPVDVVELLLDANPSALISQDAEGWTPIHLVLLYGGDEEIALLLIRRGGAPAASLPSPYVGTPLHLACRHGSCTKIVEFLLSASPSLAWTPNETGTKPAAYVWNHFARNPANERIMKEFQNMAQWNISTSSTSATSDAKDSFIDGRDDIENVPAARTSSNTVWDLLDRMTLLVQAAKKEIASRDHSCGGTGTTYYLSSSLVYDMMSYHSVLGDLSQILALLVRIFPSQAEYCDPLTDNLPLHVAASTPPGSNRCKAGWIRQYSPRIIDPCKLDVIEILVRSHPSAAARVNKNQDWPLHLALTKGRRTWNTGISVLVEAESDMLLLQDTATRLYPFQLAAAFPVGNETEALGTVLELLLACPHAINH
jgi:hypothetical protein